MANFYGKIEDALLDISKEVYTKLREFNVITHNCSFSNFIEIVEQKKEDILSYYALEMRSSDIGGFVKNILMPLSYFATSSGVLDYPDDYKDFPKLQYFMQQSMLQCVLLAGASNVNITVIDLKNFGNDATLLNDCFPTNKINYVSSKEELDDFLNKMQKIVVENIKLKGRSDYVYEYNLSSSKKIPYNFVFITSLEQISNLGKETVAKFKQLLKNQNASKSGCYFFIASEESNADFIKEFSEEFCINSSLSIKWSTQEEDTVRELIEKQLNGVEHIDISYDVLDTHDFWIQSSESGISAVIGKDPEDKDFSIEIGGNRMAAFNALLGGGVGSGKTTLLHTFILGLAQRYSPNELRMALLDYKEGTEFSIYENLPHIFALSLGSKAKFGKDLLTTIIKEKEKRGALFRQARVSNIEAYRNKTNKNLPRLLIVIDEFQRLFNDNTHGEYAKIMAEDLIRTGRSFGINMILSSQSLSDGALQTSIIENIPLRICLRLSERESANFLSHDNTVPTTFKQRGEAVANYQMGEKGFNQLFQTARIDESESLDLISKMKKLFEKDSYEKFEKYIYVNNDPVKVSEARKYAKENEIALAYNAGIPPSIEKFNLNKKARVFVCASDFTSNLMPDYIESLRKQYTDLGREFEDVDAVDFNFEEASVSKTYFVNMDKLGDDSSLIIDNFVIGLADSNLSLILYGSDYKVLKNMYLNIDIKICFDKMTAQSLNLAYIRELDFNNIIVNYNNSDECNVGFILTAKE